MLFLYPHAHLFPVLIHLWIKKDLPCLSMTVFVRPENLSLGFASAELAFDAPSSPSVEHETGEEGYTALHPPPPQAPRQDPLVFVPRYPLSSSCHQTSLLPAPFTVCLISWAAVPQLQRETRGLLPTAGHPRSSPDSDVLSLFISFSVGSIVSPHPSWPPVWLPSHSPFYNSAEKQNL